MPRGWCQDPDRRREARVPEKVTFQTKSQLAIQMLEHAWAQGVPLEWVAGDEIYGDDTRLRDRVAQARSKYVLAVSANTPVWRECQPVVAPFKGQGAAQEGATPGKWSHGVGTRLGGGRCLGISGMEATGGGSRRKGAAYLPLGAGAHFRET